MTCFSHNTIDLSCSEGKASLYKNSHSIHQINLGLNETTSTKLGEVSDEHKWAMICQYKKLEQERDKGRIEGSPHFWVHKLRAEPSVALLKELQAVLGSESLSWVKGFIEGDGLSSILDLLGEVESSLHQKSRTKQLKYSIR